MATFPKPAPRSAGKPSVQSENEFITEWRRWMRAQRWSERTEAERTGLICRVARLAGCEPEDLTTEDVLDFLADGTFGDATAQTYYVGLKSWFEWLVDEQLREDNPMDGVRKPKAGRRSQRFLSTAHLEHLVASRMHARTRTMILLSAYQGLRAFEIAKVRGADIDHRSNEIVVHGKGGTFLVLPLHPIVKAEAARYDDKGWWFPQWTTNRDSAAGGHVLGASVSRVIADAMRRAGAPGTAHSLRRWHATEMVARGVNTRVVQELMRHGSISTTERYIQIDDRQRRAAIMLLPDITKPPPADDPAPALSVAA